MMAWALAGRLVLSVGASAWQKRLLVTGMGPAALWWRTYLWMTPAAAVLLLASGAGGLPAAFWGAALAAGALDAAGNLALGVALRRTDLSVFGPLNAFRPVLALGFSWLVLGERPTPMGTAGVVVLVAGGAWLLRPAAAGTGRGTEPVAWGAVAWRIGGLALSSVGAVYQKQALGHGSVAATLAVWVLAGTVVLAVAGRGRARGTDLEGRQGREFAGHAAVFLAMQALTLVVFRGTLLAYAFAFFQLAMVLQVLVGHGLFGEPHPVRRLAACGVMGAGALLVLRGG